MVNAVGARFRFSLLNVVYYPLEAMFDVWHAGEQRWKSESVAAGITKARRDGSKIGRDGTIDSLFENEYWPVF